MLIAAEIVFVLSGLVAAIWAKSVELLACVIAIALCLLFLAFVYPVFAKQAGIPEQTLYEAGRDVAGKGPPANTPTIGAVAVNPTSTEILTITPTPTIRARPTRSATIRHLGTITKIPTPRAGEAVILYGDILGDGSCQVEVFQEGTTPTAKGSVDVQLFVGNEDQIQRYVSRELIPYCQTPTSTWTPNSTGIPSPTETPPTETPVPETPDPTSPDRLATVVGTGNSIAGAAGDVAKQEGGQLASSAQQAGLQVASTGSTVASQAASTGGAAAAQAASTGSTVLNQVGPRLGGLISGIRQGAATATAH